MKHSATLTLALLLSLGCNSGPDFGGDLSPIDVEVLVEADALELVALDPEPPSPEDREDDGRFHGYGVRGRATLGHGPERTQLLELLAESCRENDDVAAACFNPRHGLRAAHGGHLVELVICFECLSYQVYRDGEHAAGELLAREQEPAITAIFLAAGLSIAGH